MNRPYNNQQEKKSRRKKEGSGLASIEDSVDASIERLEDYIQKHGGGLITAIRNNTDYTRTKRTELSRKEEWEEKQLYGHLSN